MAGEQLSMDSILNDEPQKRPEAEAPAVEPAAPEPDAAAKETAEEQRREEYKSKRNKARDKEAIAQGKVRDPDTGQFVSPPKDAKAAEPAKAEEPAKAAEPAKPAAPAAPEFTDKEKAFLRAAQEERGKRQELERRIAAMEAGKPKEPEKGFWDDPEGALAKHEQKLQMAITGQHLKTSETIARTRYTDFDEKVAKFAELAQTVPGLGQQMIASADPAEFAYKTAKNHMEIQEAGGLDAMRTKMEADIETKVRTRLEAELKAKADALAADRAALPESLSQARATGGATKPVWSGPPSMDSILNDK